MRRCERLAISLCIPVLAAVLGCRPQEPDGEGTATGGRPATGTPATTAPPAAPAEAAAPPETAGAAPATSEDAAEPLPADRPLRAGFLVVDGVYNTELAAPYDVLQHTVFH